MLFFKALEDRSSSRCNNLGCGPRTSSEPRIGDDYCVGDIIRVHKSVYDPFYQHIGGGSYSAGNSKPGHRPGIIVEKKDQVGKYTVCLMATFDKKAFHDLPLIFQESVVLVPTTDPSDKALDDQHKTIRHVHTTPEWQTRPAAAGGLQFVITIPVVVTLDRTERWGMRDMPANAGFFLDPDYAMKRLQEKISEHARQWDEYTAENRNKKLSALLRELKRHEKEYKSSLGMTSEHRKQDGASRMSGRPRSYVSAGFTPPAEGGIKDVDGFSFIGPRGKPLKANSKARRQKPLRLYAGFDDLLGRADTRRVR